MQRRKPKLKISMQDIDNLYKPIKKEVMNTEEKNTVPATVEPQTQEAPKYIEVSIFGSKLEPVLGKVYLGQFLGVEEIEQVNENGEITYFKSCNFIVETLQANGIRLYEKTYVSTTTFLNSAEKGLIIPNEWYKLEYKGEGQNGNKRYHIWDIVHIKRIN